MGILLVEVGSGETFRWKNLERSMLTPDEIPKVETEEDPDQSFANLNKECWRLLTDMIYNGTVLLRGGMVMSLKPEAFFDQVMRLAQMKPPKTRKTPGILDFTPEVTYRGEKADPSTHD